MFNNINVKKKKWHKISGIAEKGNWKSASRIKIALQQNQQEFFADISIENVMQIKA